jgi:ATP-dependent Lon protease
MSGGDTDDDIDGLDLPPPEPDAVSTGAAADSADAHERLKNLPRLLRYAMLICGNADHVAQRLIAEIDELCPQLAENAAWAIALDLETGLELAAELDRRAVTRNEPSWRSLADCVRLVSLPTPRSARHFDEYRRVGKALVQAFRRTARLVDEELCCDLERFTFGWAALPVCTDLLSKAVTAAANANVLGKSMAEHRIAATKAKVMRRVQEEATRRKQQEDQQKTAETSAQGSSLEPHASPGHLVVARLSKAEMKNPQIRDIVGPLESVINVALPLAPVPPLQQVREALLFEFPYASEAIEFALADLVGRSTVRLRPLILVGAPGGGKSRFARRLAELLGVPVWTTDAARADGTVFGGTDRRWSSAEPSHPFLAIAQGKVGNPLVVLEELEKGPTAITRTEQGLFWNCLLSFLEPETSGRYPDPALQTTVDLSQVSYVATCNSLDPLPSPLRDRFRVVTFPKPTADHLDALLPGVIAGLAKERGLDTAWLPPLDGDERAAVAMSWRGGSVRRLRRIVEAIVRERDLSAASN